MSSGNKYLISEFTCSKVVFVVIVLFGFAVLAVPPLSEILNVPAVQVYASTDNGEEHEDNDNDNQQQDQDDQQQQQESEESSVTQPQPQVQQPQSQSQPQTQLQPQGQPQTQLEDFIIGGKINSLLPVGNNTWISDGNWNMVVENGDPKSFTTQMIWTSADGTTSHTHDFLNLLLSPDSEGVVMGPTDTLLIQGELDVATNRAVEWQGVPAAIYIGSGKTIAMTVDDAATNSHFGGQPIYGLITSFTPCGASGPNMEVSPPCE